MPSLSFAAVRKSFARGPAALDGIDLAVRDGECFALVGPSGAGKSTLLRVAAGLEAPDAGRVLIGGRDVTDVPPHRRGVAFVPQRPALYPHLTVGRNLAVAAELAGVGRAEVAARVADAADRLRLTPLLGRRPAGLSGGERQRVALGRAVVRQAAVWLLDEPFGQLDPPLKVAFRDELHLLRGVGPVTMLIVTHDPADALALGDRVGVLRTGRLEQVATPHHLRTSPGSQFAAAFTGPTVNLVAGTLTSTTDGTRRFRSADGVIDAPVAGRDAPDGTAVTAGLRPEDLRPDPAGGLGEWAVRRVEPHGGGWLAAVTRGTAGLRVACPDAPEVGSRLWLAVDPGRVMIFDAGTGLAIPARTDS